MEHEAVRDPIVARVQLPTITEVGKQLRNGSLTSETLTKSCLERIYQLEPQLNAWITIAQKQAVEVATALDSELESAQSRGSLHGIPLVLTDIFDTVGIKTTVGSSFFFDRLPQSDATVVERLQTVGAVLLGKTNLNEFASGISGHNNFYGDTHNPWNLDRSPGGSSSGTACAIAAGMSFGGLGTDTGGSIRIPASWCGIVGIRPTSGLVSMAGVYSRSSTLDVTGPLGNCVADAAMLLDAITHSNGPCNPNSTISSSQGSYTDDLQTGVCGLRLGVIKNYTFRCIDPEVAQAIHTAINTFIQLKAEVIAINIPWLAEPSRYSAFFNNIVLYEFNQTLGDHYRTAKNKNMFSPAVQESIETGMKISQKTYKQAQSERQFYIDQFEKIFQQVDVLLTPTTPTVAPLLSAHAKIYSQARQFTLPFSLTGVPAISVPCGFNHQGLPIGLQIVGNHFKEALILQVAAAFEAAIKEI